MEGMGVRRVARDNVEWIEAASTAELATKLVQRGEGFTRDAYGIWLNDPPVDRRWIYGADEFFWLWRRARNDGFAPGSIVAIFLSGAPALTIRSGDRPKVPSYETDTGHVWVDDRPRVRRPRPDRPRSRRPSPGRSPRGSPPRDPETKERRLWSDLSQLPRADRPPAPPAPPDAPRSLQHGAVGPPREPLRRTPHIDVEATEPLQPGADFEIEVYCDTAPARPGEDVQEVTIDLPPDRDEVTVRVWLALSGHFSAERLLGDVTITRDEDASTRARFGLRVVDEPPPGPGRITAVFHHEGRTSGQVARTLEISHRAAAPPPDPEDGDRPPHAAPRLEVRTDAVRADLTIEIKSVDGSEQEFACRVITELLPGREDPEPTRWTLKSKAPDLVAEYMRSFTQPDLGDGQRISLLEGAGMDLWRAAPAELRAVFWKLIDDGLELETIFVVSDEWSFPWELAVPNRGSGRDREKRKPLGVEFAVGRWVTDEMVAPPQRVDVVDSYVFAPRYAGRRLLKKAAEEARYVVDNLNGEAIEPGDHDQLEAKFAERGVALAHFVCHGSTSDGGRQLLRLEDGGTLAPQQIQAMPGLSGAIADRQPLVFLNACEVGRGTLALVGVNGFATAFARSGATCVIAPLWNVADDVAHLLATGLYDALRADPAATPAGVLRALRDRAYATGGADSWAAYCFYGDPLTEVVIH